MRLRLCVWLSMLIILITVSCDEYSDVRTIIEEHIYMHDDFSGSGITMNLDIEFEGVFTIDDSLQILTDQLNKDIREANSHLRDMNSIFTSLQTDAIETFIDAQEEYQIVKDIPQYREVAELYKKTIGLMRASIERDGNTIRNNFDLIKANSRFIRTNDFNDIEYLIGRDARDRLAIAKDYSIEESRVIAHKYRIIIELQEKNSNIKKMHERFYLTNPEITHVYGILE